MVIRYDCPQCGAHMESPEDLGGEVDECPVCGAAVRVPQMAMPPVQPPITAAPPVITGRGATRPFSPVVILRWLAIIPCALVSGLAGFWVSAVCIGGVLANAVSLPDAVVVPIVVFLGCLVGGAAMAFTGATVAPSQKGSVAMCLGSFGLLLSITVIIGAISKGEYVGLGAGLGIASGAIPSAVWLYRRHRSVSQPPCVNPESRETVIGHECPECGEAMESPQPFGGATEVCPRCHRPVIVSIRRQLRVDTPSVPFWTHVRRVGVILLLVIWFLGPICLWFWCYSRWPRVSCWLLVALAFVELGGIYLLLVLGAGVAGLACSLYSAAIAPLRRLFRTKSATPRTPSNLKYPPHSEEET